MEKYYNPDEVSSEEKAVKLAIRALLEVVQSGGKNLEIAVMRKDQKMEVDFIPFYFLNEQDIYIFFRCWTSTQSTNL